LWWPDGDTGRIHLGTSCIDSGTVGIKPAYPRIDSSAIGIKPDASRINSGVSGIRKDQ
jgi:hypothetical protein